MRMCARADVTRPIPRLQATASQPVPAVSQQHARGFLLNIADARLRGSAFLKQWMEYLEEHADLRYPNLADVYEDQ